MSVTLNFQSHLHELFMQALDVVLAEQNSGQAGLPLTAGLSIERSRQVSHGDYACNLAMKLTKPLRKPPRDIAQALIAALPESAAVEKVEIAGAGFINVFIATRAKQSVVQEVLLAGAGYGHVHVGGGKKVQVEFVSANPTGPLHIGHGRGAAVGDSIANILNAAGYDVVKEFYVNDAGRQVYTLGESVKLRLAELQGKQVTFPEDFYKGDYVKEIARDYEQGLRNIPDTASTATPQEFACNAMLKQIEKDLKDFGVEFDNWYSEKKNLRESGLVMTAIHELEKRGVVFDEDGAQWFRTTQFGDDKDRVLSKADGELTYFASDIAYHWEKVKRGFSTIINVWGADHHGYEARVMAALKAFGYDDSVLKIIFIQLVALQRNGVPVPMGKREGEFVTLRQVMDEIGTDACRFFFLMRKSDAHLDFDLELAKKQTPENPVFYVQYAHARICSIIKHAKEKGLGIPKTDDVDIK